MNIKPEPMTIETARQIGGALQRLQEIGSATIIDPAHEAEQKGLIQFLARVLPQHANELLANWFAVKYEYEPLINGFRGLLRRATAEVPQQVAKPENQGDMRNPGA